MSDMNSRATVTLNVNGQQAQQTLNQLRENALNLETAMAKAAAAGNKTDLKRLRKELTDTKRQIREIESSTLQVESVLKNLDKATPRELNKSLQTLNKQLEYIERGTKAWDEHTEKIRKVKDEIAKVNGELKTQESSWDRFNRKINDYQTTIMGAAAAFTGLVMAGRSAVSAFADMDAEMANVRKFTGMNVDEVQLLNEEFKKMDTRTSREELNKLAEEAGRLGKSSQEDVMGFVRAADKINVALDDLGEGATLTLSKLTNIFGDEKRLGTEEALLSVGSVINELSQNCTASAPYLANFAQRMAGVGAQAGLTIPQLMAFGAVLDSQGQACEMSATALSKLTMDLFKDTERVAKATGIPLQELKDALSQGTNEGLILLLEKLHDLGDMSVLAPIFKDMGENGARASQVIAALAGNIDTVKWEQEEATKAFNEATSVTNEYNVQNNTVQAGLDKAKKKFSEMAIELGEKLQPVMAHVISTSTIGIRILSQIVSFVAAHTTAIVTITASLAAYTLAVNASNIAFKLHYAWVVLTETAHKALNVVLATGKTVVLACSVAYNTLTGNTQRAAAAQQLLNKSMKANVFGLVLAAGTALILMLKNMYDKYQEQIKARNILDNLHKQGAENAQEEINKVKTLRDAVMNETLSMKQRQQAVENLNKIIPGYNAQLDTTTGKYKENKKALDAYIDSLVRKYEIEGAKDKLKEIGRQKADLEIQKTKAEEEQKDLEEKAKAAQTTKKPKVEAHGRSQMDADVGYIYTTADQSWQIDIDKAKKKVKKIDDQMTALDKEVTVISKAFGNDLQEDVIKETTQTEDADGGGGGGTGGNSGTGGTTGSGSETNKFKAEEEWKERELALNAIAYSKGEKQYEDYTSRIDEIALEFYDKQLEHTDLSAQERIKIEGERAEELIKQNEKYNSTLINEENQKYEEQLVNEKQRYIDGKITLEDYNNAINQIELDHLRSLTKITKDGSKERAEAEKHYQDRQFQDTKKRQEQTEQAEKKLQEKLKKIKEDAFGLNPKERESEFSKDMLLLQQVYAQELVAAGDNADEKLRIEEAFQKARFLLMKKYNVEELRENQNFLQNFNDDLKEWLNSDMGQAVMESADVLVQGMSSIFSQMSSLIQSEVEIQTAAIESKYEKEISLAEGNNYKVSKLEKEKEEAVAKIKNDANKKMFAMQVIQAVAQTATGAINAYSSAAAIPVVGYIMAPIAAAMAVAAGMLQVAAIKKQQQASEAQGYAEGGFTPSGDKDQAVGIVHAGEWVASQELVNNPTVRPVLEALDYAQRNNKIGSLTSSDVSRTITAPVVAARNSTTAISTPSRVIVENSQSSDDLVRTTEVAEVLKSLNKRLSEPFVTVNTVTGDTGIKKAQDEYSRLIANKSPKKK